MCWIPRQQNELVWVYFHRCERGAQELVGATSSPHQGRRLFPREPASRRLSISAQSGNGEGGAKSNHSFFPMEASCHADSIQSNPYCGRERWLSAGNYSRE